MSDEPESKRAADLVVGDIVMANNPRGTAEILGNFETSGKQYLIKPPRGSNDIPPMYPRLIEFRMISGPDKGAKNTAYHHPEERIKIG